MERYAIIVAGGSGTRMGGGIPKQFQSLNGRPVLWWSMKAFHDENSETRLILVLPKDFITLWKDFFSSLPDSERFPHEITVGGATRSESVSNGLALVPDTETLVAVHDGARPLVKTHLISKGWETALKDGAAIPVVAVTDSLRRLSNTESHSVDRSEYVAVQTPQVFKGDLLKHAYEYAGHCQFTDDAAVVENYGHKVSLYEGSPDNLKITHPQDLDIAEVFIKNHGRLS